MITFKRTRRKIKRQYYWWKYLRLPIGKKVYLIGTPDHSNIGDSAIVLAEKKILQYLFRKSHVKEITFNEFVHNRKNIESSISKNDLLVGHGGGNLGNLWYNEELFRYSFIDAFPNNPIIIFPQTVFFTDDEEGRKAQKDSLGHYENHRNLTLVAREKKSFETLNTLYRNPKKILVPDIVLSTTMKDYGVCVKSRSGVLLVFRGDSEKSMTDNDRKSIKDYLEQNALSYRETDMYSDEPVTKENRMELVRKKMQEFADAELVITDRLHGMVFAAITETPCIVFSNNHHKVKGTYDCISNLDYIRYVDDIYEAAPFILELMKMKECKYNNKPLEEYYDNLAEEVKRYVN